MPLTLNEPLVEEAVAALAEKIGSTEAALSYVNGLEARMMVEDPAHVILQAMLVAQGKLAPDNETQGQ